MDDSVYDIQVDLRYNKIRLKYRLSKSVFFQTFIKFNPYIAISLPVKPKTTLIENSHQKYGLHPLQNACKNGVGQTRRGVFHRRTGRSGGY